MVGVTGGLAVAATTTTSPKAGYWEHTNSNINMSVTGGKDTTIETSALPAGSGSCTRTRAWTISDHPIWRLPDRRHGNAGPQCASRHDGATAAERYPARSGGGGIRGVPELPFVRKVLAAAVRVTAPCHDFTTVYLATATRTSHDHSPESRTQPPRRRF